MSQDKQPHSTHQADSIMLTLVLILAVLGLLILFSASEYNGRVRFHDSAYYFKKQLFATALGLGAMFLVSSAGSNLLLHMIENVFGNDRFMCILDTKPFFLWLADFLFVLVRNVGLLVVDAVADIGFIFQNFLYLTD